MSNPFFINKGPFNISVLLKLLNSKIVILSHLGRPKGKIDNKLSMKPVCDYLCKKLGKKVKLISQNIFNQQVVKPAHSHNDYLSKKPLYPKGGKASYWWGFKLTR